MKYDEFKKAVDRIIEDEDTLMIHVSPDFQCDQTLGFPTSLCVCWEQGKAWLAPNDFMMSDLPDDQAQDVLNACAEYFIAYRKDSVFYETCRLGTTCNAKCPQMASPQKGSWLQPAQGKCSVPCMIWSRP